MVLIDPEPWEAIDVVENLNVQLLELRYFDALLERRLADSYALTGAKARRLPLWNAAFSARSTIWPPCGSTSRAWSSACTTRSRSAATSTSRSSTRGPPSGWASARGRRACSGSSTCSELRYSLLIERVRTARSELLETTIVLLIVLEIVLALFQSAH
jgi:hypothetical protein